jgi:putative FmdB family regulatory protein
MPTYEYSCQKCGSDFEIIQPMSAPPLKTCPKNLCTLKKWGRGKVKKKISAGAGLLFKGTGFYITDYRSKNYTEGAKKDSAPAKPAEGKSSSSGESKSAAKTEGKPAKAK